MPAFTRFYGIKPTDIDSMSRREIDEYRVQMEQAQAD